MNLNEYQKKAESFAAYKHSLYPFMALGEEAGEVQGKVAKALRKTGKWQSVDREAVASEIGDVLWNVALCARELDLNLSEIAYENISKLEGRVTRGTIVGEGDVR